VVGLEVEAQLQHGYHRWSSYFTCIQNMKLVTKKFKSGGLHEKHVVATWNFRNHLSICFQAQGNQEKPVS